MQELSDGLLLRIGTREGSQQKARRYLLEGRVMIRTVGPKGVRADVRGQGHTYNVSYEGGGDWSCTCPARTPRCCHVVAVPH
ncbi:MAG: SWIM zinc finger family protein [Actinomycetota bacterium]